MDYFYQINSTIDSYYAIETEELSKEGYSAKFSSIATGDFKWKRMEAYFFNNGKMEDFNINEWVFSYRIEGYHRIYNQMSPDSPEFIINGLDPLRQQFKAKIYTSGFFREAVADFMNNITLYSKFPNRDVAQTFNTLQNWISGSDRDKNMEELLPIIIKLKDFYKSNYTRNSDGYYWDRIKMLINESIEKYLKNIEDLKI